MKCKVISLNIWNGGRLLDGAIALIKQEAPDILALQEVYDGKAPELERRLRSYDELQSLLDYKYSCFDTEIIDNLAEGKVPQGNAVFSRFPIASHDVHYFLGPVDEQYVEEEADFEAITRNIQSLVLDTPAGKVTVHNFHGVYDLDGEADSPARRKMSDAVIAAAKDSPKTIVTGDTNAKPANPAIQRIGEHLRNVYGSEVASTFNMRRKDNPGYATAPVDMIFISPDIECTGYSVPDVDVSDHLPVIAVLNI